MSNRPIPTPLPAQAVSALTAHKAGTIFASASRAAGAHTSDWIANPCGLGIRLSIDVTDVGAGPGTVTVKVQVRDPATGNAVDLPGAVTAAINAPGTKLLTVYPGIGETANESVSEHIGHEFRVVATVATNAVTFSVGGVSLE